MRSQEDVEDYFIERKKRISQTLEVEDMICDLVKEWYGKGGVMKNPSFLDLPHLLARLLDEHDDTASPWAPSGWSSENVMAEYVTIKARRNEVAIRLIHDELMKRGNVGEENAIYYNDLDNRMFALPAKKDNVRAFCVEDQNCRFVVISEIHERDDDDPETEPFGDIMVYRYWDVIDPESINERREELEDKCSVLDAIARSDWDTERWSDVHDQYSKRPPLKLFTDWLMGGPGPDRVWTQPILRWNVDPSWPDMRNGHGVPLHLCISFFLDINSSCCELGIEKEALVSPYEKERA